MGLCSGKITFILFSELFIIGVVSAFFASLLAAIFIKMSLGEFEKMLYIEVIFDPNIIIQSIMSTVTLLLLIVFFIMLCLHKSDWQSS